jgi:hypothetical protein
MGSLSEKKLSYNRIERWLSNLPASSELYHPISSVNEFTSHQGHSGVQNVEVFPESIDYEELVEQMLLGNEENTAYTSQTSIISP